MGELGCIYNTLINKKIKKINIQKNEDTKL